MKRNLHFQKINLSIKITVLVLLFSFGPLSQLSGQTNSYIGGNNGAWGAAANWSLNLVPLAAHDVTIPDGLNVRIAVAAVANSVTIGGGTSGSLEFDRNGNWSLTVSGDLTVQNGAVFRVRLNNGPSRIHTLIVGGSISNSGIIDLRDNAVIVCNVFFNGTNQAIGGTGLFTELNDLTFANSGTATVSSSLPVVAGILTVDSGSTLNFGTSSLGGTTAPASVALECGATTGSFITGTGLLSLGGNVTVSDATGAGTGGAIISCPVALGATRTFTVADDGTAAADFTVSGVIGTANGLIKAGAGTLILSGTNTFSGAITINGGVLSVGTIGDGGTAGHLGAASNAAGNLVLGGGSLQYTGATASTNRNFTLTAATTSTIDVTTNNLTLSGASTATTGALTKAGAGTLVLSGTNLYTGLTTVSAGTLQYGVANALATGPLALNGGTFSTGAATGFGDALGTLALTENSTVSLGTGVHSLNFAASGGVGWTAGKILTINGWAGAYNGTSGTAGKIFAGATAAGLTANQLRQIQFYDGSTYFGATLLSSGELVPAANAVTAGAVSSVPFCVGPALSAAGTVAYTAVGSYSSSTFSAKLSDAAGSFTSPVTVGTATVSGLNPTGTLSITIPAGTASGTGYKIRIDCATPAVTGVAGSAFEIISGVNNVSSAAATAGDASATLSWTNPLNCYDEIVIVAKEGSAVSGTPTGDGFAYTASLTYGSGTAFGGGYVVSKGTTFPQIVTNLTNGSTFYFKFFTRKGTSWSAGVETTAIPAGASLASDYFRSLTSGNWNAPATWESSHDGANWFPATLAPTNTANAITVQSPHVVTVTANVSVDQTTIQAGGQVTVNNVNLTIANGAGSDFTVDGILLLTGAAGILTPTGTLAFNSGSTYQHARDIGTIPIATWDVASTCKITGVTTTIPGGLAQTFGNFQYDCPGQAGNENFTPTGIAGNLEIVSTNASQLRMNVSISVGGNFTLSGGTFVVDNNAGRSLTIAGNGLISGGTLDLNRGAGNGILYLAGDFLMSGGTLTESGGGTGTVIFNKTGTQTYSKTTGTISANVNFTVNSGSILDVGTSLIDGSAGTFTLSSGAGIRTAHVQGLSTTAGTGNIQVTGLKTYSTGANYTYNGTVAQVTGNGLPATVNNLTIDNSAGVTLTANTAIGGILNLTSGILTVGASNAPTVTNNSTGAVAGGSAASFVNGPLTWQLATGQTYSFPVGKGSSYLPFGLTGITGTTPRISIEAFTGSAGGSATAPLTSLSSTEYWLASLVSGTYSGGSVSLTRQASLGGLSAIGRSATQGGAYSSLNGTISGTSILNADNTANLGYFLMAAKSITTGTISPIYYCPGESVSVPFTSGTFSSGNVFTAQLSNAGGSFASPVNIGTLASQVSGTINATIPGGQAAGTGYRIRVVSSSPAVTGSTNVDDISIGLPTITSTSPGSRCGAGQLTVSATVSSGFINWYSAATGGTLLGTGPTYQSTISTTTIYYAEATTGTCTSPSRSAVTAYIISPPSISITGGGATYCSGDAVTLTSTGSGYDNLYWEGPDGFYSTQANPTPFSATVELGGTYMLNGNKLSGINLVSNGDFESGNTGFTSSYGYVPPVADALLPEGVYTVVASPGTCHTNFCTTCPDHSSGAGTMQMAINGAVTAGVSIWAQTVNVVPNTYYQFTYWVQTIVKNNDPAPSQLQLFVNGLASGPIYIADATTGLWTQFLYNWSSGANTTATLSLVNQNTIANGNDFALDDIIFQHTCTAQATVDIQVNAVVTAGTIGSNQAICTGVTPATLTSTLAGTGSGTIAYEWQTNASGSYVTISGANAASYSPPALFSTTSYQRRTVSVNGGKTCYSPYTTPVTITVSGPTVTSGGPDVVCQSATPSAITLTGAGFTAPATTAAWSIVSGLGSLSNTSQTATPATVTFTHQNYSGTVTLRLTTAGGGCTAIATRTITIRPTPTATISGTTAVCQDGAAPNISFTNPQSLPVTIAYAVNGGPNSTIDVGANATATVAAPATTAGSFVYQLVNVVYQSAPACSNGVTGTATVTINPLPATGLTVGGAGAICSGASTNITVASSVSGTNYQLRDGLTPVGSPVAGTGGTINLPTGNLVSTTTFNVLATIAATTCSAQLTQTATVTVSATPTTAAAGPDQTLCNVTTATLAGTAATVGTGAWSVVSGTATITTASSPTSGVTGLVPGASATLRWAISNAPCTASTDDVVISVDPASVAGTASAALSQVCLNASTTLSLSGSTGSIQWEQSADGTTGWANVTGSGATTATYTTPVLSVRTYYRAKLTSGTCAAVYSNILDITIDAVKPVFTGCPSSTTIPVDAGLCSAQFSWSDPTASDACSGVVSVVRTDSSGKVSGNQFPLGNTTISYSATDASGNTETCSFTVTVTDNIAPSISCPAGQTIFCAANIPAAYTNYTAFTSAGGSATDICGIAAATFTLLSEDVYPTKITRTYRIADLAGNTASCTQDFTFSQPNVTISSVNTTNTCIGGTLSISSNSTGLYYQWQVSANSGSSWSNLSGANSSSYTGALVNQGDQYRLLVSDTNDFTNLSCVSISNALTFRETTPPVFTLLAPASQTVCTLNGAGSVAVNGISLDNSKVTDVCTSFANLILAYTITGATTGSGTNLAEGTVFNLGTSTVSYTATDQAGMFSNHSFTVTVNQSPVPVSISHSPVSGGGTGILPNQCGTYAYSVEASPVSGFTYTWKVFAGSGTGGPQVTSGFTLVNLNNPAQPASVQITWTGDLAPGTYTLELTKADALNNCTASATLEFSLQNSFDLQVLPAGQDCKGEVAPETPFIISWTVSKLCGTSSWGFTGYLFAQDLSSLPVNYLTVNDGTFTYTGLTGASQVFSTTVTNGNPFLQTVYTLFLVNTNDTNAGNNFNKFYLKSIPATSPITTD